MGRVEPLFIKFEDETVEEAVEAINKILYDLYINNRWIVYFSCKIFDDNITSMFLCHVRNINKIIEYRFHIFELPEQQSNAQQVLYEEFSRVQDDGWYIKTSRIVNNRCCLLLNKR